MATMTITIPDADVQRLLDAVCTRYGWRSQALDGTKASFAKAKVASLLKGFVRDVEGKAATNAITVPNITIT